MELKNFDGILMGKRRVCVRMEVQGGGTHGVLRSREKEAAENKKQLT
jgi:hypothetical protein